MSVEVATLESLFPVKVTDRRTEVVRAGSTVEDLAPDCTRTGSWGCIVNGKTVHPDQWATTHTLDGYQLIYAPLPADLVTLGTLFLEGLAYAAAAYVVSWGVSQLIGVPEVPTFEGIESSTYSFNNLRQTAEAGIPIKIVYGTHPVAGNILELDLQGNNPAATPNAYGSSIDMTVGLCEGEISAINSVTINGNNLSAYSTMATQSENLGTNTQTALGSIGTTATYTVGIDMNPGQFITSPWYEISGTLSPNANAAAGAPVTGSNGITGTAVVFQGSWSGGWIRVHSVSADSNMDEALTSGTVTTFWSGANILTMTNCTSSGVSGGDVDLGESPGEIVSYTTTGDVDKVRLNILFPQGLYTSNSSGIVDRTTEIQYRYWNLDDPTNSYTGWYTETVTSNQIGGWVWTIDVEPVDGSAVPRRGTYKFQVRDYTTHEDVDGFRKRLDSVVEIQNQKYRYPNIATLRLEINADSSLNGSSVPTAIANVTGRKITKWDGVSLTTPNFIDAPLYNNPAWIVYDLLTNTRYGIGNWVDSTNIDLQSFKDWADWCDELVDDGQGGTEARCTWNGIFDGGTSAWDAALTVCSTARATLYTVGELIKVKYERARAVTQLFTMGNIVEGSWSQAYTSRLQRPTRIDVQFLNAANNYQVDVVGIDDPDAVASLLPQRILKIELPGVTRESQALREARFRMNLDQLGQVVAWEADIDAVACEPGDLVRISHDLPEWGESGRIVSGTTTTVTLDRDLTLKPGVSYNLMVRHSSDDSRETKTITTAAGTYASGSTITVDSAFTTAPVSLDLYAAGPFETHSKEVVITSLRTTGDLTRTIEGLVYDPAIHDDAVQAAASPFLSLPNNEQPPQPVTRLVATELQTTDTLVAISWQYPNDTPVGSAKVWARVSGSGSSYTQRASVTWPATQVVIPFQVPAPKARGTESTATTDEVTWEIAVTAVSPTGAHLPPTSTTPVTITPAGTGTIPDAPTEVVLEQDDELLRIAWTPPTNTTTDRYEIRRGAEWVGSQAVGFAATPEIVTEQWSPTYSSGISENYMVRAVSVRGVHGSIGSSADTNTLGTWMGGTVRPNNFRDSGSWTGVSLTNLSINSDGDLEQTTAGTLAKAQTGTYSLSANATYRIGLVVHVRMEDFSWQASGYAWNSREAAARTWSGYADSSLWDSVLAVQYRTRTSASGTWTGWRPFTTRTVSTDFKEIQMILTITPSNDNQSIKIQELYLMVETT